MSELSLTGSLSISDQLILSASLLDTDGNTGTMGQVFSSTVTGSMWVDADSGAQGTQGTQGTKGEIGTQGTQGIQGETGTTGTQGTQGTQGETGTQGENGTQGETGTDGTFGGASFDYTFDSGTTAADPGTGEVALSSTTQNTATEMYIDATDDNGSSINTFMTSIDAVTSAVKGHVRVSSKTDANTFLLFAISDLTNNTGWWTIDILIEASSASAPFSNSDDVVVSFVTTGDRGDKGDTGTQGTSGDTGAQGTSGATPFPYIGDAQITGSLLVQGDAQVEGNDAFVYQGKGATTGYQGIKLENSAGNFQAGVATNVGVFFTDSTANSANVGTSVSNNLHLATDDTVRLTIDSSGQTGIGTTSPGGVFDVSYDAAALNAPRLTDTRSFAINNGAGLDFMGKYNTAGNTARFGSIYGKKENATDGNNAGYLEFQTNNVARLTISSSGDATFTGAISTPQVDISGSLSTTGSVEFSYIDVSTGASAWSTGGALQVARNALAGAGTQDAGLAFGGCTNTGIVACTEEYNGSSWSGGGTLNTGRKYLAGAGTQNAGLAFGGDFTLSCTEEYNGSSWSTGGALQIGRMALGGAGTQDAALAFGGCGIYRYSCTEEYDGTSWSNGGAMGNYARNDLAGAGTQNAGLSFGGFDGSYDAVTCTEEYNGSSWSTAGALSLARCSLGGAGTQDAALAFGGLANSPTGVVACTEEYDGSSWSTGGALQVSRFQLAGAGTTTAGLAIGGKDSSQTTYQSCTEEYNVGTTTCTHKKTFKYDDTTGVVDVSGSFEITGSAAFLYSSGSAGVSAWSTGGTMLVGRDSLAGAGTQDAGLAFGGCTDTTRVACTEEYGGSSWTTGGAMATARNALAGAGIQNATLAFGGYTPSYSTGTELYNGILWSGGGALNNGGAGFGGAGTQDATLVFGGNVNGVSFATCTEEYDGTSWSTGGVLAVGRACLAGAGTQNAGLAFGGTGTSGDCACTEEYNGTSWSNGGALQVARDALAGAGTQDAGLAFGGAPGGSSTAACTEEYNGTAWSTGAALGSNVASNAGAGTQTTALSFGGTIGPAVTTGTQEYSPTITYIPKKSFEYDESNGIVILSEVASSSQDYEDDTAAAAGGVPVGGLYRNGNVVSIRIS